MSSPDKRLQISFFIYVLAIVVSGVVFLPVLGGTQYMHALGSFSMGLIFSEEEYEETYGRILFVGDVMLGRDVERTLDSAGAAYPYKHLRELFDTHRYQIANFEASIPSVHQPTPDFTYAFAVKEKYAAELREQGFTHLSLANNHSFDFGDSGYTTTRKTLEAHGMRPFGTAYSVATSSLTTIANGDISIAIVALDLTVTEFNETLVSELFGYARSLSDQQIVYVHWGEEYKRTHNDTQERIARILINEGADLIIGHHPHVVQDIGLYNDVPVFYSLGNFIFDQYFSPDVQTGLMLSVDVHKRTIDLIPVTSIGSRLAPRVMNKDEREIFLAELVKISEGTLFAEILDGHIRY